MQNTPKNQDIQCDFYEKSGYSQKLSVQLTSNLTFLGENSENLEFSAKQVQIFKY